MGFFLALISLLSVFRCWRFVLDVVAIEVPLTFAWCTWFFMVCGDFFSSCCVEMVASWGLTGFLVKVWFMILSLVWGWFHYYVMVYSWYVFRVVTCYIMFIWSMLSLLRWLDHVVMFMFLRSWLELWHWSWFSFLVLSKLVISWKLHDISMLHLELAWIDWL